MHVAQLVGNQKTGHHQKALFANLANRSGNLSNPLIDILRKVHQAFFLTIVAGNIIAAPVNSY